MEWSSLNGVEAQVLTEEPALREGSFLLLIGR